MILGWLTYVGLTLVVLGWGSLFWRITSFCLGKKSRFPLWGEIGFYGLFTIGILATLYNFFFPINAPLLIFISALGLMSFFAFLLRNDEARQTLTKSFVLLSITISFFLTIFAAYNKFGYDAGLYHLPSQLWMRKEPVVLGLANLHDRFGFNSILDAISAVFWLSNNNFILVSFAESLFFFFYYLTLLEFLVRDQGCYRSLSLGFCLLSPLSILILDDYFVYSISYTDSPAALAALLCIFSFLRLADRLSNGETVDAELPSLHILAAFAIALKLSSVPVLFLVGSSYLLLFRKQLFKGQYFVRVAAFSCLTLIPTISRSLALSGCFVFPIALSCVPQLPWSAEHNAKIQADAVTAWARAPGPDFWNYQTGWDWLTQWGERYFELLVFLIITTIIIFVCGYFYSHVVQKHNTPLKTTKSDKKNFFSITAVLLLLFEGIALGFWFWNAPDVRFGIMALHMLTLLPALLTVAIIGVQPESQPRTFSLFTGLGILLLVSSILKISSPSFRNFVFAPHLYKFFIGVPVAETIPDPQYGVRPVKPDSAQCWIVEEPCSPSTGIYREFAIGKIGPYKAFLRN